MAPRLLFHKLENVALAFNFIEKTLRTELVSIDAHDIVQQKEKQTINVLFAILRASAIYKLRNMGIDVKGV